MSGLESIPDVYPDATCRWCKRQIRLAPIAGRWWHLDSGGEACASLSACELSGDQPFDAACPTCDHAVLVHKVSTRTCSVCEVTLIGLNAATAMPA